LLNVSIDLGNDAPGTGPRMYLSRRTTSTDVTSIVVFAGDGSRLDQHRQSPRDIPVTMNGEGSKDTLTLGGTTGNLDNIHSPVTFNGGDDTDNLQILDGSNPFGALHRLPTPRSRASSSGRELFHH